MNETTGIGNDLIGDIELLLLNTVIRRRALFRHTGHRSMTHRAECELKAFFRGSSALLLPSATAGAMLILEALRIERGKRVAITTFGWLSNWSCIRRAGLVPLFLPLDRNLSISAEALERNLGHDVGAVVVVHMMGRGQPQIGEIADLCSKLDVPLLEDIAQSFGVEIDGKPAGTFGTAAWCSLNHHKILSTGDGGFILTRDERLFEKIAELHDHGCTISCGRRQSGRRPEPGLSLRVNELSAAVLRAQMARFPLIRSRIQRLNLHLSERLFSRFKHEEIPPREGDIPFTVLFRRNGNASSYPSLSNSGWHIAENVPWLRDLIRAASNNDPELRETSRILASVSAIGSGFVDSYCAVPLGLPVSADETGIDSLLDELEKTF